ncbi:MAG: hypothetical protein GY704_15435 [Phycisphaeraceae bacterium]|nr:hypothetical protein [Phycisphaeraceae bacterium]
MSHGPQTAVEYRNAIRKGDRRAIAKAITLIESTRPEHAELGQRVLEVLAPLAPRRLEGLLPDLDPPGFLGSDPLVLLDGRALLRRGGGDADRADGAQDADGGDGVLS